MFPLIISLFCKKAALAIPTLALMSSSLLVSSVTQLPRYLKRCTSSKCTLSNNTHFCFPFYYYFLFLIKKHHFSLFNIYFHSICLARFVQSIQHRLEFLL